MGKINENEIKELFIEIKHNNEIAFEKLYNRYNKLVYGIAFSILKKKEDSEDVVQTVFSKIYALEKDKLPTDKIGTWIYTVTKNETLLLLRKNNNDVNLETIYDLEDENNEIDKIINKDSYNRLINGLNSKEQEIVSLKILSNFTFKEIGELLGESVNTIKWRYYKSIYSFPIPMKLKDGGSIEFKALLYSVTQYHKLAPENAEKEYMDGIKIEILGMEIMNTIDKKAENPHYDNTENIKTVLSLEDKINEDNDAIWCGTFQLIWNDLKKNIAKQNIVFTPQLEVVENLNKETFTVNDLSEEYYYKKVGTPSLQLKEEIEKAIKEKFNETSDILDEFEWENRDPKDYFLYAMLKKNFEFEKVFEEFENGEFGNYKNVEYFGIRKNSESDELRKQVEVLYYNSKDDFAIKLRTKQEDEVILCKNPKGNTFNEIYQNIEQQKNTYKGTKKLQEGELLKVPNIKLKEKTEFTEIQNEPFYFSNGDEYEIEKALQTIEFELDKTGGKIKSEAGMMVKNESAIMLDEIREFSVDNTFGIFLTEKGKEKPYFAGKISDISKVQNGVVKPNNIEEQNKTSKLAQMYMDMIEDIMEKDQGLQENIKFIAVDFSNFRRPLTEIEKSEKHNMPDFDRKEEKEEWEKAIKSKPIEDKTKLEIVEYLKEKYPNIEIKQSTLEELVEQGVAIKEQGIKDGILIYVSRIPEIIEENKAKLELTKYRGPLGAYFIEYETKYKDNEWQLKTISEAIS